MPMHSCFTGTISLKALFQGILQGLTDRIIRLK